MKSMKYRIFEKGMINNGFKYEIGKRYKANLNLQKNKFYFYNELYLICIVFIQMINKKN